MSDKEVTSVQMDFSEVATQRDRKAKHLPMWKIHERCRVDGFLIALSVAISLSRDRGA
jgi:hypothetical protein